MNTETTPKPETIPPSPPAENDGAGKHPLKPLELPDSLTLDLSLLESANEWAEIGRACMKKAMDSIAKGHFGTADSYRATADEAFVKELRLRESPNTQDNQTTK